MIVDCHTHWGTCYQARDGHDPSAWLEFMDRHGVTHAVVMPTTGLCVDADLPRDNDDVAAVCALSGGRMIPTCTANPWAQEAAMRECRRGLEELGARAVKFHPWLQGASCSTNEMDQLCEMAAEFDVPVIFHDGTPCFSLPSQVAALARRHPTARIVLGHCGLFEHWREAIAAMNHAENLWGCLCGPHWAALKEIVRRCDRQRIVWGSDHGFALNDAVGYRLRILDLLNLTDGDRETMFCNNPKRLFRLAIGG